MTSNTEHNTTQDVSYLHATVHVVHGVPINARWKKNTT